ncbi:mitochondrial fission process protein 1-like [Chrysoperla carnea]|uniref:mitochondrial fission process protein 1-like n=1 Tax=Chrysoperla carnea TaxID=189513 RepID=UPI001D06C995|nr:mitochondrial fission process protein 1-like [Chrysoperla carnea]
MAKGKGKDDKKKGKGEEESKEEKPKESEKAPDFFRHPYVRYLAYAPEFGNALATFSPCHFGKFWCYFNKITQTYILLDSLSKGNAAYLQNKADEQQAEKPHPIMVALDRYVWHMFASVILPRYSLYGIRQSLIKFSNFARICQEPIRTYFVTALALASIPVIIKPIDELTDHIMDNSFRKIYGLGDKPDDKDKKDEDKDDKDSKKDKKKK